MIFKNTKYMLIALALVLTFAAGTLLPKAMTEADSDNHWSHSGTIVSTESSITQVNVDAVMRISDSAGASTIWRSSAGTPSQLGLLSFVADDTASNETDFVTISAEAVDDTNGSEEGLVRWSVADGDGISRTVACFVGGPGAGERGVGINTCSPDERLHVEGDFKINGNIVSDGEICIGSCP